eukprot:1667751-Rhodomonas_salina.7
MPGSTIRDVSTGHFVLCAWEELYCAHREVAECRTPGLRNEDGPAHGVLHGIRRLGDHVSLPDTHQTSALLRCQRCQHPVLGRCAVSGRGWYQLVVRLAGVRVGGQRLGHVTDRAARRPLGSAARVRGKSSGRGNGCCVFLQLLDKGLAYALGQYAAGAYRARRLIAAATWVSTRPTAACASASSWERA